MNRIDSDQVRQRQRFTAFRAVSYGAIALWAANVFGLLFQIPGLWALGWFGLLGLALYVLPMLITAWFNLRRDLTWYEGFDPDKLVAAGLVFTALIAGIVMQAYRVGAL